jgi:hypothetical protein
METEKFSFKGFKLSKNFWSAVKNALYVLVPAILTELVSNNLIATGTASLIGPMICKAIEYYVNP